MFIWNEHLKISSFGLNRRRFWQSNLFDKFEGDAGDATLLFCQQVVFIELYFQLKNVVW